MFRLISKDAAGYLRRAESDFQGQIVVQRAYWEGEEKLSDEKRGEKAGGEAGGQAGGRKDFIEMSEVAESRGHAGNAGWFDMVRLEKVFVTAAS